MDFGGTAGIKKRGFAIATQTNPVLLIVAFCLLYASNTTTKNSAEAQKKAQFSFTSSDTSGIIALAGAQAVGDTRVTDPAPTIEAVRTGHRRRRISNTRPTPPGAREGLRRRPGHVRERQVRGRGQTVARSALTAPVTALLRNGFGTLSTR